jgi:TPR repeat protein
MAAKWSYVDKSRAERITRLPALTAAAESDDVEAQVVLAWEYASGEIVYPDIATAWRWFERAAASGDENASVASRLWIRRR